MFLLVWPVPFCFQCLFLLHVSEVCPLSRPDYYSCFVPYYDSCTNPPIITGFRDLMLIPPEEETIEDIKATVEPIIGIYGHKNLYYDIVRTGRKLWVSVISPLIKTLFPYPSSNFFKMNVFLRLQRNILTFTLNFCQILSLPD